MRLAEMKPHWVSLPNWAAPDRPFYVGVSFTCPCAKCSKEGCPTCGHKEHSLRLHLKFWPPIDPTKVGETFDFTKEHHRYNGVNSFMVFEREGETFDNLTLAEHVCVDGHWNGRITNGELIGG